MSNPPAVTMPNVQQLSRAVAMLRSTCSSNSKPNYTSMAVNLWLHAKFVQPNLSQFFQQLNFIKSDSEFESGFESKCLLDRSQNVTVSSPCRHQSFCRVSWKLAVHCMRNANKSPKIPYSAMVREVEKWSGICIWDWITTKSSSVLQTGRPNHNTKFQWNRLSTFAVILLTDRTTDRMTEKLHWSRPPSL